MDKSGYGGGWETPNDNPVCIETEIIKHRLRFYQHKSRFNIAERLINSGDFDELEKHIDKYFSDDDLDQFINQ